jgi:hypothetical protein
MLPLFSYIDIPALAAIVNWAKNWYNLRRDNRDPEPLAGGWTEVWDDEGAEGSR